MRTFHLRNYNTISVKDKLNTMEQKIVYTSQTRLSFDIDRLLEMGIDRAFVTPFATNNEILSEPEVILSNLEVLAGKAKAAAKKGLEVFPFFVTINHRSGIRD